MGSNYSRILLRIFSFKSHCPQTTVLVSFAIQGPERRLASTTGSNGRILGSSQTSMIRDHRMGSTLTTTLSPM
ncbi:hypothetical protein C8Q74DRAFT_1006141 [Fomes fomentarius]|nr:hypothetical protein C8Q74DRAFT_1006141 [Fomes fomentarius]